MTGRQADELAGTYPPATARFWWVWAAVGFVGLSLAVVLWLEAEIVRSLLQAFFGSVFLVLSWLRRNDGLTVLSPEGIRVRRGLRWRCLSWDDVVSVDEQDRWSGGALTLRGRRGEVVRVAVPGLGRTALLHYAQAHRSDEPRPG